MSVIPLTLVVSLCLVLTFVVFFLREQSQRRFSSAESDALLPLAREIPRPVPSASAQAAAREGHREGTCGCRNGERPPCAGCLRRSSPTAVTSS